MDSWLKSLRISALLIIMNHLPPGQGLSSEGLSNRITSANRIQHFERFVNERNLDEDLFNSC
jgi:hypothetical protein